MSHDISISLLKKFFFVKHLQKSSREGGTHFQEKSRGQSNMTTILINFGSITHDHFPPSVVPYKYSKPSMCHGSTLRVLRPTFSPSLSKIHFEKQNRHWVRQQPVQPSISEDSAIRIVYTLQRLYSLPTPSDKSTGIPPQTVIHRYAGFG
jgi:hypothetical protein